MTDTMQAEIDAIWDRHQEADAETVVEPVVESAAEAEVVLELEKTEADKGPARGEDGKFKAKGDGAEKPVEPKETSPEEAPGDEAQEAQEGKSEVPGSLPKPIRDDWDNLKPEVREAFKSSQDKMARQLSEVTRVNNAIQPIRDILTDAVEKLPKMQGMTPEQVAGEVFELAQWANKIQDNPAAALAELAKHHGVTDVLKAQLTGEAPADTSGIQRELAEMKRQLTQATDPARFDERISQRNNEITVEREVTEFARSKADWADVEPHMPNFIAVARQMNQEATNAEVLDAAYDMAINAIPALRGQRAPAPDPEKTRAALAATKVNTKPSSAGGSSPLTDRQAMDEIWKKHHG